MRAQRSVSLRLETSEVWTPESHSRVPQRGRRISRIIHDTNDDDHDNHNPPIPLGHTAVEPRVQTSEHSPSKAPDANAPFFNS